LRFIQSAASRTDLFNGAQKSIVPVTSDPLGPHSGMPPSALLDSSLPPRMLRQENAPKRTGKVSAWAKDGA